MPFALPSRMGIGWFIGSEGEPNNDHPAPIATVALSSLMASRCRSHFPASITQEMPVTAMLIER